MLNDIGFFSSFKFFYENRDTWDACKIKNQETITRAPANNSLSIITVKF